MYSQYSSASSWDRTLPVCSAPWDRTLPACSGVLSLLSIRGVRIDPPQGPGQCFAVSRHKRREIRGHAFPKEKLRDARQSILIRVLHVDAGRAVNVNVDEARRQVPLSCVDAFVRSEARGSVGFGENLGYTAV